MELATDVIFQVFSSANNDFLIYVFAAGVVYEIRYVGTTELKNIPYVSAGHARSASVTEKPGYSD